jgi:hypothetical protein
LASINSVRGGTDLVAASVRHRQRELPSETIRGSWLGLTAVTPQIASAASVAIDGAWVATRDRAAAL